MILMFGNMVDDDIMKVTLIHYMPDTLTDEEKQGGIEVENTVYYNPEYYFGKNPCPMLNVVTKEFWYEYEDRPLTPEEEKLLEVNVTSDKYQIVADGEDYATVSASVYPVASLTTAYILINGNPITTDSLIDGRVEVEVSAETPGLIHVEVAIGTRKGFCLLEAVPSES